MSMGMGNSTRSRRVPTDDPIEHTHRHCYTDRRNRDPARRHTRARAHAASLKRAAHPLSSRLVCNPASPNEPPHPTLFVLHLPHYPHSQTLLSAHTYEEASYLARTCTARRLHLDRRQDHALAPSATLLLCHLPFGTWLLEHHLCVSALVRVGVVKAHCASEQSTRNTLHAYHGLASPRHTHTPRGRKDMAFLCTSPRLPRLHTGLEMLDSDANHNGRKRMTMFKRLGHKTEREREIRRGSTGHWCCIKCGLHLPLLLYGELSAVCIMIVLCC